MLGDIPKVTPSSKVVGDLAQFLVTTKVSEDDLVDNAATLPLPNSVVQYMQGALGCPPGDFPEPFRSNVLKGRPFADGRDRVQIATEIDAYNAAKEAITKAHKCHWLEITQSTREHGTDETYLVGDKLHYSGKEYTVWAERLAEMVRSEF